MTAPCNSQNVVLPWRNGRVDPNQLHFRGSVKRWISGFIVQESRLQFSNLAICIWYYLSTQWPVFMKVAELQRTLCISLTFH
ncbi:uncharacterized protein LOC141866718 isoform X2 [Acropora palmata]|uniref:uncharacterized protein LOC141866718 isoform X2 n=1 Tax=Acropora palmata TaxID=6131 RepID=UPI003DA0A3B7